MPPARGGGGGGGDDIADPLPGGPGARDGGGGGGSCDEDGGAGLGLMGAGVATGAIGTMSTVRGGVGKAWVRVLPMLPRSVAEASSCGVYAARVRSAALPPSLPLLRLRLRRTSATPTASTTSAKSAPPAMIWLRSTM
jgi:hypothetical protein